MKIISKITTIINNIFETTEPNKFPNAKKHKSTIGPYSKTGLIMCIYCDKSTQFVDLFMFTNIVNKRIRTYTLVW